MPYNGVANLFAIDVLYACKQVYKSNSRATSYRSGKLVCNTYMILANKFTSPVRVSVLRSF